jgi:hypothetical protein
MTAKLNEQTDPRELSADTSDMSSIEDIEKALDYCDAPTVLDGKLLSLAERIVALAADRDYWKSQTEASEDNGLSRTTPLKDPKEWR